MNVSRKIPVLEMAWWLFGCKCPKCISSRCVHDYECSIWPWRDEYKKKPLFVNWERASTNEMSLWSEVLAWRVSTISVRADILPSDNQKYYLYFLRNNLGKRRTERRTSATFPSFRHPPAVHFSSLIKDQALCGCFLPFNTLQAEQNVRKKSMMLCSKRNCL